jgi:hypothetical protein
MKWKRIATWSAAKAANHEGVSIALVAEDGAILREATLTPEELQKVSNRVERIKAALEEKFGVTLDIFIHINRDGSVAIAIGAEPAVWPEDESPLPDRP